MVSYSVDLQLPEHVWGRCLLRPVYKGCALFTRAAPCLQGLRPYSLKKI